MKQFRKGETWKRMKRSFFEGFYSMGTLVVTGFVLWWFLEAWLVAIILAVFVLHEMGHYFAAVYSKLDVWLPFYIPLIYGVLAGTHVGEIDLDKFPKIAMAGPIVGFFTALAIGAGALFAGFMPGFWAALWLMLFQVWSATLGADGRKFRRYRRMQREHKAQEGAGRWSQLDGEDPFLVRGAPVPG